jgi:hypothetical protein
MIDAFEQEASNLTAKTGMKSKHLSPLGSYTVRQTQGSLCPSGAGCCNTTAHEAAPTLWRQT